MFDCSHSLTVLLTAWGVCCRYKCASQAVQVSTLQKGRQYYY
jgi:hypothetical protein